MASFYNYSVENMTHFMFLIISNNASILHKPIWLIFSQTVTELNLLYIWLCNKHSHEKPVVACNFVFDVEHIFVEFEDVYIEKVLHYNS